MRQKAEEVDIVAQFRKLVQECLWYKGVDGDELAAQLYAVKVMAGASLEREQHIQAFLQARGWWGEP